LAVILHLVDAATFDAWQTQPGSGPFRPASLATEGFVHCTGDEPTLLRVANTFYRRLPGELVVLDLDEAALTSELRWEDPVPAPPAGSAVTQFPHVYGPIDRAAVRRVRRLVRDRDGTCTGYADRT
jgi:uncharacterized protein (DUF952 family)